VAKDVWVSHSYFTYIVTIIKLTHISAVFPNDRELKPEAIMARWKEITTFGESASQSS
jgi:hypothetical protein